MVVAWLLIFQNVLEQSFWSILEVSKIVEKLNLGNVLVLEHNKALFSRVFQIFLWVKKGIWFCSFLVV